VPEPGNKAFATTGAAASVTPDTPLATPLIPLPILVVDLVSSPSILSPSISDTESIPSAPVIGAVTKSKPANATKGDKTLRAAKKVNTQNNPKLASATLDVIDSFFKD